MLEYLVCITLLVSVVQVFSAFSCGPYVAIDLTFMINQDTIFFNGSFSLQPLRRSVDPYYASSNTFSSPEHGGTHIDAPYHFNRYGPKLGEIPLADLLLVEGVIIDVSNKTVYCPEYRLTVQDILDWERRYGDLPNRCVVMVNFGWAHKYTNRTAFLGIRSSDDFDRHFPGVGRDAAKYLVSTGKVLGVGVDTSSLDASSDVFAHQIILGHNCYGLEYLALDRVGGVPPRGFKVIILPMRIENGTGAPANVVILVNPKEYRPIRDTGVFSVIPPATDFTTNAAKYLVSKGKVLGVGVDTSSLDASSDNFAHQIILGHNCYGLEYLALDRVGGVPPRGIKVIILPMRIEKGTGAPANVVILVNPSEYRLIRDTGVFSVIPPATDFTTSEKMA